MTENRARSNAYGSTDTALDHPEWIEKYPHSQAQTIERLVSEGKMSREKANELLKKHSRLSPTDLQIGE